VLLVVGGCGQESGDKFIGVWKQVNAGRAPQITANIAKADDEYSIASPRRQVIYCRHGGTQTVGLRCGKRLAQARDIANG
jgi:hypothetical protein